MKKAGQELLTTNFGLIKKEYESYYTKLMRSGKFPLRPTKFGYWGYSAIKDVFEVFKKFDLKRYKNFIDLGSGDGKVVLVASLFTDAAGFELDRELFKKSIEIKNNVLKKIELNEIKILNKDYLDEDLSKYEVIYHYPDKPMHEVENKLLKEMNNSAILIHYGNYFFPLQLKLIKKIDFNGMGVGIYKI